MDKNYNVDDILSEIKRRKSLEKGAVPTEGFPTRQDRTDSFRLNIPEEEDAGFPYQPGEPAPKVPPKTPAQPQRKPPQAAGGEGFRFAPPEQEAAQRPPVQKRPPVSRQQPPAQPQRPAQNRPGDATSSFQFKTPPEEPKGGANPLEFTGHVRPITDRAKMRPNRFQQPDAVPRLQKLNFNADAVEDTPPVQGPFDSRSFRPPAREGFTQEHTRILPQFHTTGRELNLEDIQKLDFGAGQMDDDLYYDEDDYNDLPGGTSVDLGEYNSIEDRDHVALDIAHTKLWLFIRTAGTALLTIILIFFALSGKYGSLPMPKAIWPTGDTLRAFMIVCTILTGAVAVVNSSTVGGGLISFFKMRANSDSLVSFALLAAICQGIFGIVKPDLVDPEAMNFYFPIAALAMLFNALGKMMVINRIQQNFRLLGAQRQKYAVMAVESGEFCREFIEDLTSRRKPTIAYGVKADFFTDFLGLSFSDKYDVGINRSVAPVCLIGGLVVGLCTFILAKSMVAAVSAFAAILCVCATLSATFIESVPLGKMAKKLAPQGAMVSGNKAVEDFCDTKALVLNEKDLFPVGHISLHGIRAFSQARIDEAILDAASVLCELDGSLAPLFLQMIGGNKKLLKKVDNIVFESGMGISAWVDSRRVLIGNRQLMTNHGIPLPHDSYERGEAGETEGEPLYLSNSGEVSARFLVGYRVEEELAYQLDQLAARDKRLIIYTTDANITPHKVWEVYGYPEELVTILPTDRHEEFREMSTPKDTAIAEIVYAGRATSLVSSILACISARNSILYATIIELVQIILGYGIVAFLAFMGTIGSLSFVQVLIYQMFWFAAIFVVQKIRQA